VKPGSEWGQDSITEYRSAARLHKKRHDHTANRTHDFDIRSSTAARTAMLPLRCARRRCIAITTITCGLNRDIDLTLLRPILRAAYETRDSAKIWNSAADVYPDSQVAIRSQQ
jgi:hypothetical protein